MKKIFVNTPYSRDANSFWRCMGPLAYMAKHSEGEIQIYLPPDGTVIGWDRISEFDLIFMHRPCRRDDLKLLTMARLLNIPVWSDYDDWLFQLPSWNPSVPNYHNPAVQEVMATTIACSDILSVSTTALLNQFRKVNDKTIILPNAYRSDLYPYRKAELPDRKEIFVWRGTNTHDGDLLSVSSAFRSLSKKVHFLGGAPYFLTNDLKPENHVVHPYVDPMMYWKTIHQLAPKVWLFPLDACFFNQCKSNIAWIEAIHAGAVCVAPNLPEWKHPGVITYEPHNEQSFYEAAEQAMAMDPLLHSNVVQEAYQYIQGKFDITVVNQIRTSVLESIFHPTFTRNKKDPFNQLTGIWAMGVLKGQDEKKEEISA